MKNYFFILFSILLISCQLERRPKGSFFDFVPKEDTTCLKDISEAKKDLENGKLTYCHYSGNIISHYLRSQKELIKILKENNIDFRNEGSSCIVYDDQTEHCYCKLMEEKINQKYGEKFIDSLLNIADEKYLMNHINDTLYYADCDTRPNYPNDKDDSNDEYSEVMQNEIDRTLIYPKGYIQRPNYEVSAFVDISFNVDKNGNGKIKNFWFLFDIKSNHKFEKYFESELNRIIKREGWKPAQIRKQNVNSSMVMRYGFK
ncbi:hypothetical protein [Flavobacterium panici]|uniref:Uncharacterized protein n=1 Tax=Flavobacterium panici TaxID=2654843 RepID=A0A9N8P1I0_9FLAO|nr:hypothetical protein [Flavobacterium panici]CAC9974058.1 hypothetical protein FLAPXU55_01751 [Flavobacterium panici]